jgi:signal transduction histidine kinase
VAVTSRIRPLPPIAVDLLIAAAVGFPTLMDAWWNEAGTRQADGFTYLFAVVSVAALIGRRRWPIPVALLCGASLTGLYVLGHHGELLNLPSMVALYTVAVQSDRRTTIVTAVVASAWSGVLGFTSDDPIGARGGSPVLEMIWPLVPLALGEAVRSRRELAVFAEAEREREAHRRVADERARLAREFHDLVAHTIAAVNVQMAAAVAAFDANPEAARRALIQARGSSRAALGELRATVTLLRDVDDLGPVPRLDDLDLLVQPVRAAGIDVVVADDRAGAALTDAVELAAYRIVQESLTNVIRHSRADHAHVSIRTTGDTLVIEVVDDGVGGVGGAGGAGGVMASSGPAADRSGFGLVGMTERARAVGGNVEFEAGADGGFRVHAVLPMTEGS